MRTGRASVFASFLLSLLVLGVSCRLTHAENAVTSTTTMQPPFKSTTTTTAQTIHPYTIAKNVSMNRITTTTTTTSTTSLNKMTTVQPKNVNATLSFIPQVCKDKLDNSSLNLAAKGDEFFKWLSPYPVLIAKEYTPVNLKCQFCLKKPVEWTKILWYKDNRLLNPDSKKTSGDVLHIPNTSNDANEGLYKCTVVAPDNKTASQIYTLIVNKDPHFSMIPSIWVRNETFSQSTLISWLVRGHGIFDSVMVIIKVRQVGSSIWKYRRHFVQYVSGSMEIKDLKPSTVYIVNITAVNRNGEKEECRCVIFWSNAGNWTGDKYGILSYGYPSRRILGLAFGVLALLFTVIAIYCCMVYPAFECRSHQGYTPPSDHESNKTKPILTTDHNDSTGNNSQEQILKL